ncbi:MAG: hypothetical protein ABI700_00965 [Chloroflexota bacterium]
MTASDELDFLTSLDFLSEDDEPTQTTITQATPLGGMQYPYLARTRKNWTILSTPANETTQKPDGQLTRWINGADVYDLYLDGVPWTDTAIANALGLKLNLEKRGFRASKRWARLIRPYHIHLFLPETDLQITYLPKDAKRDKLWDGAGIVSRKFLTKMSDHLDTLPLSPRLRRRLQHQLAETKRVEFTIQTSKGQDKGHAIVSETLDADFMLIEDTKTEVTTTDGMAFIGINPIHAHDHMRLDIQSLINLRGQVTDLFWTNDQLLTWLHQTGITFGQALESGDVAKPLAMLDGDLTLDDITRWYLHEYFASNGQTMHFKGIIKTLMNQHLKQIRSANLDNLRLPIPGGRYYVMPAAVGQAAGLKIKVRRGHVLIDPTSATAWVNDRDWLKLPNSPTKAGIARILGGADNDDALWIHGFTDYNGQKKLLCWRSPNQHGEYVVLKPETHSLALTWYDGTRTSSYPPNDSRKLPQRIDFSTPDYLNLIPEDTTINDSAYSIDAMWDTVKRIRQNEGALGMYCNLLMLTQALYDRQPKQPAARLEDAIDGSVKDGRPLAPLKEYCYEKSDLIVASGIAIPRALWKRLSVRHDDNTPRPRLTATTHHWLDHLISGIRDHISTVTAQRDQLMLKAQPPLEILQYATEHDLLTLGGEFNQIYALALQETNQDASPERGYDLARERCETYLVYKRDQASPEDILTGALASCTFSQSTDAALWQPGPKSSTDTHSDGIAQLTLQALRQLGLIDYLQTDDRNKIVRFPATAPNYNHTVQLDLNGTWYNYLLATGATYTSFKDVPQAIQQEAKAKIAAYAHAQFQGYALTLRRDSDNRLKAYGPNGRLFAYVAQKHEALVTTNRLTIVAAKAIDGNLRAVCQSAS